MISRQKAGLALLLIALLGPASGNARGSTASTVLSLKGTNRLYAARPSVVSVRVSQQATIKNPLVEPSSLQVSGEGKFVGFVLVEESRGSDGSIYVGGRLSELSESDTFFFELGDVSSDMRKPRFKIQPGDYRLYLLPDKGATRITFRLGGISGRQTIKATKSIDYQTSSPDAVRTGNLYASGADGRLTGAGLLLGFVWFQPEVHAASRVDFCQSKGPTPDGWTYMPGTMECDGSSGPGGGEEWTDALPGASDTRIYYGSWQATTDISDSELTTYQHSVTVESASALIDPGSLFAWLSY